MLGTKVFKTYAEAKSKLDKYGSNSEPSDFDDNYNKRMPVPNKTDDFTYSTDEEVEEDYLVDPLIGNFFRIYNWNEPMGFILISDFGDAKRPDYVSVNQTISEGTNRTTVDTEIANGLEGKSQSQANSEPGTIICQEPLSIITASDLSALNNKFDQIMTRLDTLTSKKFNK